MPAEQLMERVADDATQSVAAPARPELPEAPATCRDDATDATFSPDPDRRSDRYRLVTPYLLRL
jgi:hypothetical protein